MSRRLVLDRRQFLRGAIAASLASAFPALSKAAVIVVAPQESGLVRPSWHPPVGEWVDLSSVPGVNTMEDVAEPPYTQTAQDPGARMRNWNGAGFDRSYLYFGSEGGHNGGIDNAVDRFGPFNTEAGPRYVRLINRTPDEDATLCSSHYSDGRPTSRHGRGLSCVAYGVDGFNKRLFHVGAHDPYCADGIKVFNVDAFDLTTNQWDAADTYTDYPDTGGNATRADSVAWDPTEQRIVMAVNGGSGLSGIQKFNPVTNTWGSKVTGTGAFGIYARLCVAGPKRIALLVGSSGGMANIINLDDPSDVMSLGTIAQWAGNGGSCYCPVLGPHGAFLIWGGGQRIDKIEIPSDYMSGGTLNPSAIWSSVNMGMGGDTPSSAQSNGTWGRFSWIEDSELVLAVNDIDEPGYVARVA